jgi:16S rRNA (guanine527-N7)-methyltransferase
MSNIAEQLQRQLGHLVDQSELKLTQDKIITLVAFVLLMQKWNKAYNLSSVRDPEQMLIRHIMDSLVVSPFIGVDRIADVGTGPGLPGIPLAIMFPEKQFTLIDSLGKRIRFIKQACYELNIQNVEAIEARVEDVKPDTGFDIVLSRAFASLADMLNWCEHLVAKNGEFLALKGQLHQDELAHVPSRFVVVDTKALAVPSLIGERHVVSIQKR